MKNENNIKSVLLTSTSYPKNQLDWKGLFIKHLADSLARRQDIDLSLWCPTGEISPHAKYVCNEKEAKWLNNLLEHGGIAHILRSRNPCRLIIDPFKLLWLLRKSYIRNLHVDLFHINWLQNSLPLLAVPSKKPLLVSVLGSDMRMLNQPGMCLLLRQVFKKRRCIVCPNADWMVTKLKRLFGDVAEIRIIPFGIDRRWYVLPRENRGVPYKWIVVSRLTKNKIGSLFEWGIKHFQDQHELHLFGPMQESIKIPDWVHYHGSTYPQDLMKNWFPQAQGLITLSRHDEGRPQVMLESMAAGLPIIASRLPAHDSLLNHKETGFLVENSEEFSTALKELTKSSLNEAIGTNARNWVRKNIGTWDDCAERYASAYLAILGNS